MGIYLWLALGSSRLSRPRRPRTLVALAAVALALLLPTAALANHLFSDVPTSHTFHTNISNLANAGVTAGCGGGKYCPEQAVTRGQMAGFLNRGLGRVAEMDFITPVEGAGIVNAGEMIIVPGTSAGALPGAKQFVRAQFTGTIVFTDITACPCTVRLSLGDGVGKFAAQDVSLTVSALAASYPISVAGVREASGSNPMSVLLAAYLGGGGSPATRYTITGNMTAETVPFGYAGTSTP